jgi:hypothetical protein
MNTTPGRSYKLHVTESQLQAIRNACELLARVHMGQLFAVAEALARYNLADRYCELREGLEALQPLVHGLPANSYPGIHSPKLADEAGQAWDIHRVCRHILAWDRNPEGAWTVDFDDPASAPCCPPIPAVEPAEGQPDNRPAQARLAESLVCLIGTSDLARALQLVQHWKDCFQVLHPLRCDKHPRYKALKPPRAKCGVCEDLWLYSPHNKERTCPTPGGG